MSIPPSSEESHAVLDALTRFPEGATLQEIRQSLLTSVDERSVQRWLNELRKDGRVVAGRSGREIRYLLACFLSPAAGQAVVTPEEIAPSASGSDGANPKGGPKGSPAATQERGSDRREKNSEVSDRPAVMPDVGLPEGEKSSVLPSGDRKPPTPSLDTELADAFASAVIPIVQGLFPRPSAVAYLQQASLRRECRPESVSALVSYGLAKLEQLTLEEALSYGLTADQYEAWQAAYFRNRERVQITDADLEGRSDDGKIVVSPTAESQANPGRAGRARRGNSPEQAQVTAEVPPQKSDGNLLVERSTVRPPSPSGVDPSGSGELARPIDSNDDSIRGTVMRLFRGGENTTLRTVLGSAAVVLATSLIQFIGQSPWVTGLLLLVGAAGVLGYRALSRRPVAPEVRSHRIRMLAIGAVALIGLVSALVWYQRVRQRPSIATVSDHLAKSLAPLPVRIAALTITCSQPGSANCQVSYQAMVETTAPLYRRIDTVEYLRTHAADELAAIDAADALLGGPKGAALQAAAGSSLNSPIRMRDLVLLTTQTPAGTTDSTAGTLTAWRKDGGWVFTGEPVRLAGSRIAGEAKQTGTSVFVVDDPADADRLKSLLADRAAYAAKVRTAAAATSAATPPPAAASVPAGARPTADRPSSPTSSSTPATTPPKSPPPAASAVPASGAGASHASSSAPSPSAPQPSSVVTAPAALPAFPTATGAYILVDARWVPLPKNNGRVVQSTVQSVAAKLADLKYKEDVLAGMTPQPSKDVVAELVFDGAELVPMVPGVRVVIAYVGRLAPLSQDQLTRYPALRTYPVIELAPASTTPAGVRRAPLVSIAPGVIAFGSTRVQGTVAQPETNVTVLRCDPLPPGHYALSCGSQGYEVGVR